MKKSLSCLFFNLFFIYLFSIFAFFNLQKLQLCSAVEDFENIEHFFNEELNTSINLEKIEDTATANVSDFDEFLTNISGSNGFQTSSNNLSHKNAKPVYSDTVPSRNYTIIIDPGHGGSDPGSIGYKTKIHEDELNLKMSKKLESKLKSAGFNVIMTRTDENALIEGKGKKWKRKEMEARRDLITKTRPNMVISLHQNSYTNHSLRGAQVFYDKKSEISKQIAESIQEQFKTGLDKSIKSPSPGDYFMLKCSSAPSVIVECGFLSNADEEKLLQTETYQDKIIDAIYKGIVNFFQIS